MNKTGLPHILLITTDTQRCDTLRCMGSSFAHSPGIDRLAREGVLFEQAHTSSPVCSPARHSLLTGVHTPIHGCIENGLNGRSELEPFTDLLKQQGYKNIMVGKTHFGSIPDSFAIQRLTYGEKNQSVNDAYAQHLASYGYERASKHPNVIPEALFMDAYLVDTTIQEIDQTIQADEGPFFAFCSLLSPHGPLDPPGHWASLYEDVELPPIQYEQGELDSLPEQLKLSLGIIGKEAECEAWLQSPEGARQIDQTRKLYYGLAAYTDAQIARLIQYLDDTGLRENTLVIFSSDHGTQLYDHGFDDKHNYYDASWRVPLIMSMPGTLPVNERRDFAIWNDITATILGAAGTQSQYVQGFDLFTPLAAHAPSPRHCAVSTLYQSAALATRNWKLEYYWEEGRGRLFDRSRDPLERNDLFEQTQYETIKHAMVEALLSWRSDLSDIQSLQAAIGSGGPVAMRLIPHTKAITGQDAEQRLNERIARIDELIVT